MRRLIAIALLLGLATPTPMLAQAGPADQVTVESYYRIKWGSAGEFKRLYQANHQPLLDEMKRKGLIVAMRKDEPLTHLAGNQRWDLRVTITYRDAASGVVVGGAWDKAYEEARRRLFPDKAKLDADEARRMSLLEEHWDVIVVSAE